MDTTKEQERAELHRAIWQIADDLRGSVDGWDFKQYVLGMLFYRYISENLTDYINQGEREGGAADFDYAALDDAEAEGARADLVTEKGYFIAPSELFASVLARADGDENLNETLAQVFRHIEESAQGTASEADLRGLFDDIDVNSNKLGATVKERNARLVKLMQGIGGMKLGSFQDNTIDAFGDAYEYLMAMYASRAGKSGGEQYPSHDDAKRFSPHPYRACLSRPAWRYPARTHPRCLVRASYGEGLPLSAAFSLIIPQCHQSLSASFQWSSDFHNALPSPSVLRAIST